MKRLFSMCIFPYTIFLLYMMFFASGRTEFTMGFIQINPFMTIRHFIADHVPLQDVAINLFGNFFVFAPYGLLGLKFPRLNNIALLTTGFILAIALIELTQYITARGTADIDDIFLNTLGMMFGYYIYNKFYLQSHKIIDKELHQLDKNLVYAYLKS